MNVKTLIDSGLFQIQNCGENMDQELTGVFCCDLLSVCMGKATEGCAWITVMTNVNTLAVAALTEAACIINADGHKMDEGCLEKAKEKGITVLASNEPVFETGLAVYEFMKAEE